MMGAKYVIITSIMYVPMFAIKSLNSAIKLNYFRISAFAAIQSIKI